MILYDPGIWSISFAFSLRGSVFPKAFVWAFPCSMMSVGMHTLFHMKEDVMKVVGAGDVAASVLGGFTFILGFLVVFRSQQAYSRWWEGGTLLQQLRGEWFNSYSCLIAFCNASKDKAEQVHRFQHQLVRLYSLLYGCALQQVSTLEEKKFELIDIKGLNETSLKFLQDSPDRCEVVLQWIQRLIVESEGNGILKIAPPILSRVFNELGNGIVNLNNARKITEFPIPFPLAQMITVMLLFHAVVTPVICAATVETVYWCATITFVVTFSYWSINYIAVELEMPFGDDWNDLPLYDMQRDMNGSLRTLIEECAQKVPTFDFKAEEHEKLITKVIDFDKDLINYQASHPDTSPMVPDRPTDERIVLTVDSSGSGVQSGAGAASSFAAAERGTNAASLEESRRRLPLQAMAAAGPEAAASSLGKAAERVINLDNVHAERGGATVGNADASDEDWRIAHELETIESARSSPSFSGVSASLLSAATPAPAPAAATAASRAGAPANARGPIPAAQPDGALRVDAVSRSPEEGSQRQSWH